MKSTIAEELAETVLKFYEDPEKVQALKIGAFASRKRYCIEIYRQNLIDKTLS